MRKTAYLIVTVVLFIVTSCKKQAVNYDSDIQWSKVFGGSGVDVAYGAVEQANGSFIIVGYSNSNGSKDSNDGDVVERKSCLTRTSLSGNSYLDCFNEDGWVLKINANGEVLEKKLYGTADALPFVVQLYYPLGNVLLPSIFKPEENSDIFTSVSSDPSKQYYIISGQTNALLSDYQSNRPYDSPYPANPTNAWIEIVDENRSSDQQHIFQEKWYDSVNSIQTLPAGEFILVGTRDCTKAPTTGSPIEGITQISTPYKHSTGPSEGFIDKGDTSGKKVRIYLGGGGTDRLHCVVQTTDGGFVAVGTTNSTDGNLTGIPGKGGQDVWIIKLNETGTFSWNKRLGGEGDDIAYSVVSTTDGGFVLAGQTNSNDGDVRGNHSSRSDFWIVRFNSVGDTVWKSTFGGAFGDEIARSITKTNDEGFVIAGQTNSNDGDVRGNHGYSDAWVVKVNKDGKLQWQKTMGGSSADAATNVISTSDGGLLVTGYSFSNDGDISRSLGGSNYWVVKLKKQ